MQRDNSSVCDISSDSIRMVALTYPSHHTTDDRIQIFFLLLKLQIKTEWTILDRHGCYQITLNPVG